jgi:tRNA isopentenyl-2-thiomethyl-A-37 hydroxylase MiaE
VCCIRAACDERDAVGKVALTNAAIIAELRAEVALMRAEIESQERVAEGLRARDGERTRAIFACQYAHGLLAKALTKTSRDRRHYAEAAQSVVRSAGWPGGVIPGASTSVS